MGDVQQVSVSPGIHFSLLNVLIRSSICPVFPPSNWPLYLSWADHRNSNQRRRRSKSMPTSGSTLRRTKRDWCSALPVTTPRINPLTDPSPMPTAQGLCRWLGSLQELPFQVTGSSGSRLNSKGLPSSDPHRHCRPPQRVCGPESLPLITNFFSCSVNP